MKIKIVIYMFCAVAMFAVAGSQHAKLIQLRSVHKLDQAEYLENAPPLLALTTTVLGGFRGLVVDILWLRISYLQDEGDYFEMVQLSDWVTKLEPRNIEIWAFHAWNMSYNISVIMADKEDRWRWIRNGITLLRDEGLLYNPGNSEMYREVGWLFQHKLGSDIDEEHQYLVDMWAEEMTELLGSGRPDLKNLPDAVRERMINEYKLLPDVMLDLEAKSGLSIDWLDPHAHSAYWAFRGLKLATDKNNSRFRCDAMLRQSLARLAEIKTP